MLKNLIMACVVIIMAVGLTFTLDRYFKNQRGDFFILEQGRVIPDFSFETIGGNKHALYDFKGQEIVIHFWASWCAPCVIEFPEIVNYARHNSSAIILAFSSDGMEESIERFLKNYASDLPENFKIIHDKDQSITRDKFSVFQLPESFLLDDKMILKNHLVGAYKGWVNL